MTVLAYHCPQAPEKKRWLAQCVFPNGDFWGVNFFAATEAEAVARAQKLYDDEITKKRRESGSFIIKSLRRKVMK